MGINPTRLRILTPAQKRPELKDLKKINMLLFFDRVPHKLLTEKLNYTVAKGCFLEIPYDYLHKRKKFVRIGFTASVVRSLPDSLE